jgi:dihydroorotase
MQITRDQVTGLPMMYHQRLGWDLHVHGRQGPMLRTVVPMTVRQFAGAVFMPNLRPPITTSAMVAEYRAELLAGAALERLKGTNATFRPLMTMYLTDQLEPAEIKAALEHDLLGVKYYPRGLTTNSESGVKNPASLWTEGTKPFECLRMLAETGRTLMLHAANALDRKGEELDPYEEEIDFVAESLPRIQRAHPDLRIVFEHLSTAEGAEYMMQHGDDMLGCTITAHHLLLDRRDTYRGGVHVHRQWRPVIQDMRHREAVRALAGSGLPFVFLGTDSAPHPIDRKEAACCVGGVLTAHCAMELYIEAFENMGKLDKLENFSAVFGPKFYGLPLSEERIVFEQHEWEVQDAIPFKGGPYSFEEANLRPFRFGEKVRWRQVT